MRSTVKFSLGSGGGVEVKGPPGPTNPELLPEWVSDLTADLTRVVYRTVNAEVWQWRMTLSSLTANQMHALLTFYRETAEGPSNSFVYTHTDSREYAARFIDTPQPMRINADTWDVSLALEITGALTQAPGA